MKPNSFTLYVVILSLFLILMQPVRADDSYKPYLHNAEVPEHPKVKLYGYYSTNLFPGAATYTYSIEVPKGINGLQPFLSITYSSQSVKQRPGILGAGWFLTQNYIYRGVNSTPDDISDDEFKLIFNGIFYDLIYDSSDSLYHTKIESFLRIQNLTGASNTYGKYWLVTSKDGTQFRFGFNLDSELTSNTDKNYALRWSLDQVEDTRNNKIFYSYSEDPNAEDKGAAYLSQILYNNEQKRKVEFEYETNVRLDRRLIYDQGNQLEESRRLINIKIFANDALVRRYNFEYVNLNAEKSLSSISKIKFHGSDNISLLHQVSFDYYPSITGFTKSYSEWVPPAIFSNSYGEDYGVRLVDLDNDGFVDFIKGRQSDSKKETWLNNRVNNWTDASSTWAPPVYFVNSAGTDLGVRFVDFDNDGFIDILQATDDGAVKKAWRNNGNGWTDVSSTWAPPIYFVVGGIDAGVQLTDFNGDGRVDLLQSNNNAGLVKSAYLNNGTGWVNVSSSWVSPTYFMSSNQDTGARVEDINGDGLPDIIEASNKGSLIQKAWLNNGTGWVDASPTWAPPVVFITTSRPDNGVRFADVNGDGLVDILEDYVNGTTVEVNAWINNGTGWTLNNSWQSPEAFTKDGHNIGRRIADVNGDGFGDILVAYGNVSVDYNYTWVKNFTTPYMLRQITNEFGGITSISYQTSTQFNNSGDDSISDIGFNVWVVKNVTNNNSMSGSFNTFGVYSYNFSAGKYDYDDFEFRGFSQVNETRPDSSLVTHYFHQDDARKGMEYKSEVYNSTGNIYSKDENTFNVTNSSNYFKVLLLSQANYLYDGSLANPKAANVSYSYDNYGNVIERVLHGDVNVTGDEKFERYFYVYNTSTWIVDRLSRYQLFSNDNTTKVKDAKYSYDGRAYGSSPARGDIAEIENWLDTGGSQRIIYEYDSFGNIIRVTDPLGRESVYRYGLRDTTYTYADKVTNALDHTTDYQYDLGTGNLLWQKENDITIYFYYDVFGRITKEVQPYDAEELPTKNYSYNFDGTAPEIIKISSRTSANKTFDVYYFYDGFANFIQLKRPSDNNQQIVKNFFYDGLGRVVREQNPYFNTFSTSLSTASTTVNVTNYTYDTLGRVIFVKNPDGTNKTINFDHRMITTYDENGHRKAYILDGHDRITSVLEYNNDPVLKLNFETDVYNTSYEYDTADNLVKITDALGNVFTFTYDSLDRRIALSDPDLGNWTYTYDLVGNLIKQVQNGGGNLVTGDGYYREYDGLNQLIKIRNGSSSTSPQLENYTYGPFGQRIKIMRNDTANTIVYTPFKELMQIRNSSGIYNFTYIYQDGVLVARVNPDGSKYFYHSDSLGSTSLVTNSSGSVVENTFYSPYGEIVSGGTADVKLYTGQFKDNILCQYYYGRRYFSPCLGIFTQPDPTIPHLYNPQSLNRYSYALNNPYKYTDPSGKQPLSPAAVRGFISLVDLGYQGLLGLSRLVGALLTVPSAPSRSIEPINPEQKTVPALPINTGPNVPTKPSDISNPISPEEQISKTLGGIVQRITNVNPTYTERSASHVQPRHHDPNKFIDKSKFKPGEGGQKFAEEVFSKANEVELQITKEGLRLKYETDLAREVGTKGETVGVVVIDAITGEVITQFPKFAP